MTNEEILPHPGALMEISRLRKQAGWKPAPRVVAGFMAVVGGIFWFYGRQPLYHTDLWGHLAYGRLIWETGALPATEPFMPLARDMSFIDTAWLAQVAGYLAISQGGPPAIQFLHALAIAVCCGILAHGLYRRTQQVFLTITGLGVFVALNWFQFRIVRPQMAGLVCCALLLAMLTGRRWRGIYWIAIPVMLAVWANLHGSFIVGLGYLGCASLGRVIDVWRRTGRLAAPVNDRRVRRLAAVTALAAAAVLLNPYGPRLYADVLSFSRNPNLNRLIEWQALALGSVQGKIAVGVALALLVVCWVSPRRVPAGESLALVILGVAALWSARMLIWWTPVAAHALVVHAHDARRRFRPGVKSPAASPRSDIWTIAAVGIAVVSITTTPLGLRLVTGRVSELKQCVTLQTPVDATDWLREHPPAGQVFNTYEWGDYLVWAGPPKLPVFVTSQAHLVPPDVWRDYLAVIRVASGWEGILDQYGVETVVADKLRRGALIGTLTMDERWTLVFEDDVAVIFVRKGS
jgi:hypothetical protein